MVYVHVPSTGCNITQVLSRPTGVVTRRFAACHSRLLSWFPIGHHCFACESSFQGCSGYLARLYEQLMTVKSGVIVPWITAHNIDLSCDRMANSVMSMLVELGVKSLGGSVTRFSEP
jgi:hypothetical protein